MHKVALCLLLSALSHASHAQTNCNNYLDNAQKMYSQGHFDDAITAIKNCSANETNTINQWQSSRLLAQCYLGLNDLKMANKAAEDMLEKNPLYKTSVIEDSKEFVNLLDKVTVLPRFSLSLSAAVGINISYPNIINSYGITSDKKTYSNGKARQIGLFTGYTHSKKLSFQTGITYAVNNYSLEYKVQDLNFKYDENLTYLQVPLLARYQIKPKGNFKVFVQAGAYTGFLTKAQYNISRESATETNELKNIEQTDSRAKTIFGLMGGAGASYKFREGHVFVDINYQYSFTNINNPDKRLDNENLIYNYYYIDDDLRLNNLTFSLGYTFYLNYFVQRSKKL